MIDTLLWTAFCILLALAVLAVIVRGIVRFRQGGEPQGPYRRQRRD